MVLHVFVFFGGLAGFVRALAGCCALLSVSGGLGFFSCALDDALRIFRGFWWI